MATKKSKNVTTAQLVVRYNKVATTLGKKPVKKFADRKTAERRVNVIEAQLTPTKSRGMNFDLPASKNKSAPRENSMRAKLLDELQAAGKKGIAFEVLHKRCGFKNLKSTRDALGLLNRKNGYGVSTDGKLIWLTG